MPASVWSQVGSTCCRAHLVKSAKSHNLSFSDLVSIGGHGPGESSTCIHSAVFDKHFDDFSCLTSGSGIGPTIQIGEETVITVDAKAAGKGKVTCKVTTPDGAELDVDVVENTDGTFDVYYTAPEPGKYVITIRFGGENIPNSPFHVVVG